MDNTVRYNLIKPGCIVIFRSSAGGLRWMVVRSKSSAKIVKKKHLRIISGVDLIGREISCYLPQVVDIKMNVAFNPNPVQS